jgi:alkylhydroperoxidase family enzyme
MALGVVQQPRLAMLPSDEAWERLSGLDGPAPVLPPWARMLAGPLPLTTARMLELDALHRGGERLDARLRGLVRWAAADANGCAYSKAIAAADLRRAGGLDADLELVATGADRLPLADRTAVAFAREMMRQAYAVTDGEVKQLLDLFGEERLVALVTLLAHASFQDRIFLAANVEIGADGPLPPLTVGLAKPQPPAQAESVAPQAGPNGPVARSGTPFQAQGRSTTPSYDQWLAMQTSLNAQRARSARIRVPSREEVLTRIGDNHPAVWQGGILWSRVCYGYQPELTDGWFACSAAFRQEANLGKVFEQSIFWVVTRSVECFY